MIAVAINENSKDPNLFEFSQQQQQSPYETQQQGTLHVS